MGALQKSVADADIAILLVEDDHDVRDMVAAFLDDLGYRVLTAARGDEALELLDRHPEIALLVTDIMLPGGTNGFALAHRARRHHPELKVIYATGHVRREDWLAWDHVSDPLLNKPFRLAQLRQRIEEALRS